jgi:N-acetylglucosaminyldiphosphoundecaprenol N-acetyl-beta-D-mannosaminyltransferase
LTLARQPVRQDEITEIATTKGTHHGHGPGVPAMTESPLVSCAGVPITCCTLEAATQLLIRMAKDEHRTGADIHLCNAYTLALADTDQSFGAMLRGARINFPDGMPVVWANRWRHRHMSLPRERVCGPDLFAEVLEHGQDHAITHYLLGSTPQVLAALGTEIRRRFPTARVVGAESPPFRELTPQERDDQARRLRESGAQIVWVGLGTPKQDWAAHQLAAQVPAVFVAIGAAFDFIAGHRRRAPQWMQKSGLEWTYRLGLEPRRLSKRYLVGNLQFIRAVLRRG